WNWDWFIPIVDAQASSALGRKVIIQHLHVQLSTRPTITADGLAIANPDGFTPQDFATADKLTVQVDVPAYLRRRQVVLPLIALDRPTVDVQQRPDGSTNYAFPALTGGSNAGKTNAPPPQIGDLRITGGQVHAVLAKLRSDFAVSLDTREAQGDTPAQLLAKADGKYANQPITGSFVGGTLLSLRDAQHPYPIDLQLANGPTKVSVVGTVQNPLSFAGADVTLKLTGPDMAQLYPLTGIPIPQTPNYSIAGKLDYSTKEITFRDFQGRVGNSDLGGNIAVDPTGQRPHVTADLRSRSVDLADLGGIVGSTPGRKSTPGQSAEQKAELTRAEASPKLIPNVPLNLPKLQAADVDLKYNAASIKGQSIPFDSLAMDVTIKDGNVSLHPVRFGIGRGDLGGRIDLANSGKDLHAKADIDFNRIELSRLMSSATAKTFGGSGIIGGHAAIEGTGNSLAALLGGGNGELRLIMTHGGNISALLVDLSGLQFGNALLSALGIPQRATIDCFVTDLAMERGVATIRTLLLDTSEDDVDGRGSINLAGESLDMHLRTHAKHFSIGSVPASIGITGPFKSPNIAPDVGELAARAGAAVALGIVATPLAALLPTIQFGNDEGNKCLDLTRSAETRPVTAEPARRR
ncbi:MAG: AsmA family protein, partial [Acetobacteraceae bacterium]|nr:AsmA family protein [Acetobacteraceae bacterium]